MKQSLFLILSLIIVVIVGGVLVWYGYRPAGAMVGASPTPDKAAITTYEECIAAGYPSMESYPEQCAVPGGKTFTRLIAGTTMTITGEVVCLPKKHKGEFQTLECAYGILADNGQYFALSDPTMQYFSDLPTGQRATVQGTFQEASADTIYDIVGTLVISDIVQ